MEGSVGAYEGRVPAGGGGGGGTMVKNDMEQMLFQLIQFYESVFMYLSSFHLLM